MSKKLLSLPILATLVAGMLPGAALAAPPLQPPPPEEGTVYTIQEGDWLSRIAKEKYGDPLAYPVIVLYNNALAAEDSALTVIDDPDLIKVGWSIVIPSAEEAEAFLAAVEEAPAAGECPGFTWPPPPASSKEAITEYLEADSGETRLRDVDKRITKALDKNGYYESSYYGIEDDGFALVTRVERIYPDGRSPQKPTERWGLNAEDTPLPTEFSLRAFSVLLKKLFLAQTGFYRMIVFTVTPEPIDKPGDKVTPECAEAWIVGGMPSLPESIGALYFSVSAGYEVTALIYEFERQTEAHDPEFLAYARIPARTHLVKAGLWEALKR